MAQCRRPHFVRSALKRILRPNISEKYGSCLVGPDTDRLALPQGHIKEDPSGEPPHLFM